METNILLELVRVNGELKSIKVAMPVWTKTLSDGRILAKLPFIGMETWGCDEADLELGIKGAIKGFCVISERFGKGLEAELEALGWQAVASKDNKKLFDVHTAASNSLFESVVETGETMALELDLSNILQAA